jgi:hypothetical protein
MTTSQARGYTARRGMRPWFGLAMCLLGGVLVDGCATRGLHLPTDPGTPFPDFGSIYQEATKACAGVRTLTAELALSGRTGRQRIRGRAIVGFERPRSMRLEGVAPFGPPAFILAARDDLAVLLLPRDNRVLRGERPEDILRALTGVGLAPAELQAVLTGCGSTQDVSTGRVHANGWASVDLVDGGVLYLARIDGRWQARAASRAGWQIEYPPWQGLFPHVVRLRSSDPSVAVELTANLSQVETNIPIVPAAFTVEVPLDARSLTLAELRQSGPLGERR